MMNKKGNLVSWDDHINTKYGKPGSVSREKYEEEFEAFKIGVLIQEARKKKNLTQEELAIKAEQQKTIFQGSKTTQATYVCLP
ncbi:MAG: hypothetical protein ACMVP2_03595 [Imperialibacter sp.]|uniref:hypothetical protein n=1 Tax=Imperialibacter sp. TaxID=2038411 RepID=UPI003A8B2445